MPNRLFVYGTLAPGRPNEHVLADIPGSWQPATVTGTLLREGWGAAAGYPGIVLDEHGAKVEGLLFSSEQLADHWARLDQFEGDGYERVLTRATLDDGTTVDAFIYMLSGRMSPPSSAGRREQFGGRCRLRLCENSSAQRATLKSTSQIALCSTIDPSGIPERPPKREAFEFSHSLGQKRTP